MTYQRRVLAAVADGNERVYAGSRRHGALGAPRPPAQFKPSWIGARSLPMRPLSRATDLSIRCLQPGSHRDGRGPEASLSTPRGVQYELGDGGQFVAVVAQDLNDPWEGGHGLGAVSVVILHEDDRAGCRQRRAANRGRELRDPYRRDRQGEGRHGPLADDVPRPLRHLPQEQGDRPPAPAQRRDRAALGPAGQQQDTRSAPSTAFPGRFAAVSVWQGPEYS